MNFLFDFFYNYRYALTIILIIIVYACIYAYLLGINFQEYIDANWYKLKQNPFIAPFGALLGKGKGKNIITRIIYNIYSYFHSIFKKIISIFTKPFIYFFKLVVKIISNIRNTLQKFRMMAQIFRNLFNKTVKKTANVLSNSYAAIIYFQEKLKLLIKKQTAAFALLHQYNKSMHFLLYSFTNGPIPRFTEFMPKYAKLLIAMATACFGCVIGGPFTKMVACPICAVCFDKDTMIDINDYSKKKIKDLFIGTSIKEGGKIIAIITIKSTYSDMYYYNGVLVSGNHLVFENTIWKRVENSNLAQKISYDTNKNLICLITENNKIYSNNILFSDYKETNDKLINNNINNIILNSLNIPSDYNISLSNNNLNYNYDSHIYNLGFSKNTLINVKNNNNNNYQIKNICDVDIGDNVFDNIVLGKVILNKKDVKLYNYKGIILSGTQPVYENYKWIRVYQSDISYQIDIDDEYIYHIITDKNIIKINNILFTDFSETHNKTINNNIDKIIENHLNLESQQ